MKRASLFLIAGLLFAACNDEPVTNNTAQELPQELSKAGKGEVLYRQYCQVCHQKKIDAMGPALKDAIVRWDNDTARMRAFIRNSGKVIASGDPRAKALYDKWKTNMTAFPNLTDEEINDLIAWMQQ